MASRIQLYPVVVALLAGCSPHQTPANSEGRHDTGQSSIQLEAVRIPRGHSIRDESRRLGRLMPGFTGVFLDKQGRLTISTTRKDLPAEHARALVAWATAFAGVAPTATPRIRRVKYDYLTLDSVLMNEISRSRTEFPGLVGTSVRESDGRIVLSFANASDVAKARPRLLSLGIPKDMVVMEVTEPPVLH